MTRDRDDVREQVDALPQAHRRAARGDRQVDRRQPRGRRRRHHVHARGRPRAPRGRAGARQDDARAHARRDAVAHLLAHPVHARPHARRHPRHDGHRRDAGAAARCFEFRKGPIFANIVLADEINRATPKTQSALLEAMQEHRVSGRQAHARARRAVRRPRDAEPARDGGDVPAPRGAARPLLLQAPRAVSRTATSSTQILDRTTGAGVGAARARCSTASAILAMQQLVRQVPVARHVQDYAIRVAPGDAPRRPRRARPHASASSATAAPRAARRRCCSRPRSARSSTGASPRASTTSAPSRIPALRHRVLLNFEGEAEGIKTDQVIDAILKAVPEGKAEKTAARPAPTRSPLRDMGLLDVLALAARRRGRRRQGRRALRRRVPAQARLPRARQPARLRRAPARRAADEEERQRRRVRRPPRLPARRRLPLPRLERLPALRAAARPPLRGGGGPRHLLHRRHERVDGASATAQKLRYAKKVVRRARLRRASRTSTA